jgi:beta-galactosidase/beta-glucuronidase
MAMADPSETLICEGMDVFLESDRIVTCLTWAEYGGREHISLAKNTPCIYIWSVAAENQSPQRYLQIVLGKQRN